MNPGSGIVNFLFRGLLARLWTGGLPRSLRRFQDSVFSGKTGQPNPETIPALIHPCPSHGEGLLLLLSYVFFYGFDRQGVVNEGRFEEL